MPQKSYSFHPILIFNLFNLNPPPTSPFLFWNARSLYRKVSIFKASFSSLSPLLIGVCETWLTDPYLPSFPGYFPYRKDRQTGAVGGGLLLLVKQALPSYQLSLTPYPGGSLEYLGVRVTFDMGPLDVLILYNPCRDITELEFRHLFNQLTSPALIYGDFNAHHSYWEPSLPAAQQNRSGSSLADFLAGSASFSLLTPPGLHTRIDPATGRASTLDLCLGSGPLFLANITTGPYMSSDHLPIILDFPSLVPPPPSTGRPRWSLRADNWHSFFTHLSSKTPPTNLPPIEAIGFLTDTLVEVGTQCFTFRASNSPRSL